MKKVCGFTLIVLVVTATNLEAQAKPRGRAFLNAPVSSAEEYAKLIEQCDTPQGVPHVSCAELVRSFNEAFDDIDDVKNSKELAAYVRTLVLRPCPQREVEIARVVDGKVSYFKRALRENEMCLVDLSHNRVISSAVCGQWCKTKLGLIFTNINADSGGGGNQGVGSASNLRGGSGGKWHEWVNPTKKKGLIVWGVGAAAVCGFFCRQEVEQRVIIR